MKLAVILPLLALAVCQSPASLALEIHSVTVMQQEGMYRVAMEVDIAAQAKAVRAVLMDYQHLSRINPAILESRVLAAFDGKQRVRTVTKLCVLIYCRSLVQVQDMVLQQNGDLTAKVIPEFSDFSQGQARWQFQPNEQGTRMHFEGELRPAFWIPPVIGAWLVRQMLLNEAIVTTSLLEHWAAAQAKKNVP